MFKFNKTYELSLSREYCARWGLAEAVRELLQNALDSESPFEYQFTPNSLCIHSRFAKLDVSTLLLGRTSKADDKDSIGSFGEGYKIALLVLTRLGYGVRVLNGDRVWVPEFRRSNSFDGETLHIVDSAADQKNEGLTFEVSGLSAGDIETIRSTCLHMQSDIGESISSQYGRILYGRAGKLYVGGLFICETQMKFGYDIKPQFLRLERDRQTVSNFDLAWLVAQMWNEANRIEEVAKLIESGIPDMEYIHFGAKDVLKEECFRVFNELNPGTIVAKTRDELTAKLKAGMQRVVHVGGSFGEMVSSAPSYSRQSFVVTPTPLAMLQAFFREYRGDMRTPAIVAFKELMAKADGWKL